MKHRDLSHLVRHRDKDLQALIDELNDPWLVTVVGRYNAEFGPRYFGRPTDEEIPTEPTRLTEFRTRLGGLLEYGLAVVFDELLQEEYGDDLRLSFVVSHQYPDYYLRGPELEVLLRIDGKLLHDESDEYSARFTLPMTDIVPKDDLIMYGAWQWRTLHNDDHELIYPHVIELLVVPAIDIAQERDKRLALSGGRLDSDGTPRVPPHFNLDTNYGKINRIVAPARRNADDLTTNIRAFLAFTLRHAAAVSRAAADGSEQPIPTPDEVDPG